MKISIQNNPLKPDHKRIVLHTGQRLSYEDFLEHASTSSTLSRSDCLAVLNCAADWLGIAAARGREADLGPLGRSRLGMKSKLAFVPDRLEDGDIEMTVSWILPNRLKQSAAKAAGEIVKQRIMPADKAPAPEQVHRIFNGGQVDPVANRYSPGAAVRIYGYRLNYYITSDDDGVFVIAEDGTERRIEQVVTVQPKQIWCIMPDDLHGRLRLEVRRRTKTAAAVLLTGKMPEPLEEIL